MPGRLTQLTGAVSLVVGSTIAAAFDSGAADTQQPFACGPVDLTVIGVEPPPLMYVDFCRREPLACRLTGKPTIAWTPHIRQRIATINAQVNQNIEFLPDQLYRHQEDYWSLPDDCIGDCEDIALEKRQRLIAAGLPGAALTLAIAFHQTQLFPHVVLLLESDAGVWVLDNLSDELQCWRESPYFFTRRERPDGRWTRYAQP